MTRRQLYAMKLAGVIWYQGDLPNDESKQVKLEWNPSRQVITMQQTVAGYMNMDVDTLKRESAKMQMPAWMKQIRQERKKTR